MSQLLKTPEKLILPAQKRTNDWQMATLVQLRLKLCSHLCRLPRRTTPRLARLPTLRRLPPQRRPPSDRPAAPLRRLRPRPTTAEGSNGEGRGQTGPLVGTGRHESAFTSFIASSLQCALVYLVTMAARSKCGLGERQFLFCCMIARLVTPKPAAGVTAEHK